MTTDVERKERRMLAEMLKALKQSNTATGLDAQGFFTQFANTAWTYLANMQRLLEQADLVDATQKRKLIIAQGIERLIQEWRRVEPIYQHLLRVESFSAQQVTIEDSTETITHQIQEIFNVAQDVLVIPSIGSDSDGYTAETRSLSDIVDLEVIPHFDISFSMLRAPYYPQRVLLTIPIYTMPFTDAQKIIWHELASLIVNPDNKAPIPTSTTQDSYLPHDLFDRLCDIYIDEIEWDAYDTETYRLSEEYDSVKTEAMGWKYFWMYWAKQLFPEEKLLGKHALPKKQDFPSTRRYLIDWRIAHLEELVEDACSTFVFGAEVYRTFLTVFERFYNGELTKPDMRHPSPEFRLEVTYHLLEMMGEMDALKASLGNDEATQNANDPLSDKHGKIPGAKELAKWIFNNRSKLINEPDDWTNIRTRLKSAGDALQNTFDLQREADADNTTDLNNPAVDAETFEELDLMLFARIDPNAGTSPANISPDEVTIVVGSMTVEP